MGVRSGALVGQRFGRLVVEGAAEPNVAGRSQARFRCDCGRSVVKVLTKVLQGHTQSCGCLKESPNKPTPPEEMVGRRFGRLVVVAQAPTRISRSGVTGLSTSMTRWVCRCDCGVEKVLLRNNLINGTTKSCGCLSHEVASQMGKGRKGIRAWNWKGVGDISGSLWGRICYFAAQRDLEVQVTPQEVWELFQKQKGVCALSGLPLRFDTVGERSQGNASLDRIDSSKGYITGNIQWVDKRLQQMKWDSPQAEFIELCRAVTQHFDVSHLIGPSG